VLNTLISKTTKLLTNYQPIRHWPRHWHQEGLDVPISRPKVAIELFVISATKPGIDYWRSPTWHYKKMWGFVNKAHEATVAQMKSLATTTHDELTRTNSFVTDVVTGLLDSKRAQPLRCKNHFAKVCCTKSSGIHLEDESNPLEHSTRVAIAKSGK